MRDVRDPCPPLFGPDVVLEPLVAAHAAELFPLLADPEVWLYADEGPPRFADALAERYRRWETRRAPDGSALWLNWAIRVRPHGLVGTVQATVFCDDSRRAEIAYVLGKQFWSLGTGTRAVRAVVAHLRDSLALRSVWATVDERNRASIRLLEKLEFTLIDDSDRQNLRFALTLRPLP